MRHEQRYPFTHLFGLAGLTVDETAHSIAGWLHGFQMPYLMPHVWRAMLVWHLPSEVSSGARLPCGCWR